jgi:hypothetical protein
MQVSQKYAKNQNAMDYLIQKVVKGGGGVWGETAMAAHPNLPESDIRTIIQWVLSLSNQGNIKKSLPQKGTITPPANTKPGAALVMSASYTDKGGNNIKALTGRSTAILNSNSVSFKGTEKTNGFTSFNYNSMNVMILPKTEGWFAVDSIDLTGVNSVTMMVGWQAPPKYGFDFEIRLDAPNGKALGIGSLTPPANMKQQFGMVPVKLQPVTDGQYHTIYVISKPKDSREAVTGGITTLQFN